MREMGRGGIEGERTGLNKRLGTFTTFINGEERKAADSFEKKGKKDVGGAGSIRVDPNWNM